MELFALVMMFLICLVAMGFSDCQEPDEQSNALKGFAYIVGACAVSFGLFLAFIQ